MSNKHGLKVIGRESHVMSLHPEGYKIVAVISANGNEIGINLAEDFMPHAKEIHLECMIEALKDSFYRIRPDLRRQ